MQCIPHNCVKINILKLVNIEIQYLLDHNKGWLILGKKHIVCKINTLSISWC